MTAPIVIVLADVAQSLALVTGARCQRIMTVMTVVAQEIVLMKVPTL